MRPWRQTTRNVSGTFADLPPQLTSSETSRTVVVPVPFEGTVSYLPGASHAPSAVLEASRALELYEPDLGVEPCQVGIHVASAVEAASSEDLVALVEARVSSVVDRGKFPLVLGGEHTTAVGAFRALRRVCPDLCFVYLDAHADLRPSYEGNPLSHASVAARFWERSAGVHVGVRSLSKEEADRIEAESIPCVWAWETRKPGWVERALSHLHGPVYLSLDVDVFDPAVLPAVGCPEPGGLGWWEIDGLLRSLFGAYKVVAVDISELSPRAGMEWCDFLVARLLYRIIGYRFLDDLAPQQRTFSQSSG